MNEIRVRFAPSPTGYLHIGGARTALFNWLFARSQGGRLILRIEDTDRERLKADSAAQILTSLKWLGITWDEGPEIGGEYGPYCQSERLEIYQQEAQRLVAEGRAYYCFCTTERLNALHEEQQAGQLAFRYDGCCRTLDPAVAKERIAAGEAAVIRLKIPASGEIRVQDEIRGRVKFSLDQLDDLIIMKSNGIPAYNFACVVDDHLMRISHVIRAEEHLPNTPKQLLLYQALGYPEPVFAHLSMILAPDRSKLSKRHGATSVEEFRAQGFLAPAIVNYLTLLGWSPGGEEEILTMKQAVELFDLGKVAKKAAIYDTKKLAWINSQYMNALPLEEVAVAALPFLAGAGISAEQAKENWEKFLSIVSLLRSRAKTLVELADGATYFFNAVTDYEEKGWRKHFTKENTTSLLRESRQCLAAVENFTEAETEIAYGQLAQKLGVKIGELIHPARLALTGRTASPGLFEVMALLGRKVCLERFDQALAWIVQLPE